MASRRFRPIVGLTGIQMSSSPSDTERLPYHGPCFVCGPENPDGLGLDWYFTGGRVHTRFQFGRAQQGPRNHVHGGAVAAVLDEAMGAAVWKAGHQVLAANLNVDYRRPVPVETDVEVEAWLDVVEGRKAYARAHLHLVGSDDVLVEARGLFVATPEFFAELHGDEGGGSAWMDPS